MGGVSRGGPLGAQDEKNRQEKISISVCRKKCSKILVSKQY